MRKGSWFLGLMPMLMFALSAMAVELAQIEAPVAVSPAAQSGTALIEAACPTFSWTSVAEASSYELVVFRIDDEGRMAEGAAPVLRSILPASSNSWTPLLDQCLKRGVPYAWAIRANGVEAASAWSPMNRLEVSSRIDRAEFERAVVVVEQYLQQRANEPATESATALDKDGPSSATAAATGVTGVRLQATDNFTVDGAGNVVGTGFSGSGAGLTNISAQTATSLAANGANCSAGNAPRGVSANGTAEDCFDVATQAELDSHKSSGDHDNRYLRLTGGTVSGRVDFNNFVVLTSVFSFPCPFTTSGQLLRAGSWCIDPFVNPLASQPDAIQACHDRKMALCPIEAIMACDIGDVGKTGSSTSCGDLTDATFDTFIQTSTIQGIGANNTGSAFADLLSYNGNGNVVRRSSEVGNARYYCCLPAPTF